MPNARTIDCATGAVSDAALTTAQQTALTALQARAAAAGQGERTARAQRQADLATLKQFAAANPALAVWQALARLLGAL